MKSFRDFTHEDQELQEETKAPVSFKGGKAEIKADRNAAGGTELVLKIDPIEIETWSRTLDTSGADQSLIVRKVSKEIGKELDRTMTKIKKLMDKSLEK